MRFSVPKLISKTSFLALLAACCLLLMAAPSRAQDASADHADRAWWKHAVFYEIYPRSFADSNNDGIGDLNGIASKLDYLHDLGVDAIWISPCFPSPQKDFGYDVSDYENIDPMYGTLDDFDHLVAAGKARHVRVVLDFVLNHSSDQHRWFLDSKSSRTSAYRDWYVWRDGKAPGVPPNNWISDFGGSAWTFDATTGQYYYHFFEVQQPDLNWRNPAVVKAMYDVSRWWYERGVAGFRLDAVNALYEDPGLHDNPVLPGKNEFGDPNEENKYNSDLPEVHEALRGLRKVADQYDSVLIGETWTDDIGGLKKYYGEHDNELQLPMDFLFTMVNKLSPDEFRKQIATVEGAGGWPVFVISNHDIQRSYNRYGDGQHNDQIAKLLAALYLTLRGTPILYYGEELGMENNDPKTKEEVQDPYGKTGWPLQKGRDGERTPMQWTTAPNAGFSSAKPWLPVPPSYKTHNVESELKDPNSILNFYRKLLSLRHTEAALLDGDYLPLNEDDSNVISYLRRTKDETILVAINMSAKTCKASIALALLGFPHPKAIPLLTDQSSPASGGSLKEIVLDPFSVYIARITNE
jgi:alpha-glucosidase